MGTQSELMIITEPIAGIAPYSRNARTHSKRQIRQIADSIKTFGFTNPVLLDREGTIIAGHGRVQAASLLGVTHVPTIRFEYLSEEQVRAYVIADNRLAEKADWDESILAIELTHLLSIKTDFDITVTGFEIPEIDLLLQTGKEKSPEIETVDPANLGPATASWVISGSSVVTAFTAEKRSSTPRSRRCLVAGKPIWFWPTRLTASRSMGMRPATVQLTSASSPWAAGR